jgi:hypothetical protein
MKTIAILLLSAAAAFAQVIVPDETVVTNTTTRFITVPVVTTRVVRRSTSVTMAETGRRITNVTERVLSERSVTNGAVVPPPTFRTLPPFVKPLPRK